MKNLVLASAALALALASAAAAGCGGSSSAASPSTSPATFTLTSGNYVYDVTSAPTNTCWGPSKNVPTIPMTMNLTGTVDGSTVTFTSATGTGGVNVPIVLTRSGDSLSGTADTDADLSSQGLDCVLHFHVVTSGTVTANDAFSCQNTIDVTEKSGASCSILVGASTNPPQFDAIPCTLALRGTVSKP